MTSSLGGDAPHVIDLPARLDFSACEALAGDLEAARLSPLRLRAGAVELLGALPLELLLRARLSWLAEGLPFELSEPSEAFVAGAARLGVPIERFSDPGADEVHP